MARVTIYVPDELRERMELVGDRVNWSATAQHAFERALDSERWREMTDVTERAMARLVESRKRFEEREREEGDKHGRDWAMGSGDYEELLRIRSVKPDDDPEDIERVMRGEDDYATAWWGDKTPSRPYAAAYVAALHEVLEEVEKRA